MAMVLMRIERTRKTRGQQRKTTVSMIGNKAVLSRSQGSEKNEAVRL